MLTVFWQYFLSLFVMYLVLCHAGDKLAENIFKKLKAIFLVIKIYLARDNLFIMHAYYWVVYYI
jgi:hypothetical protein